MKTCSWLLTLLLSSGCSTTITTVDQGTGGELGPTAASGGLAEGGLGGTGSAGGDGGAGGSSLECEQPSDCLACIACSHAGACEALHAACLKEPECSNYIDCVSGCSTDDGPCAYSCQQAFAAGYSAGRATLECTFCTSCASECEEQHSFYCEDGSGGAPPGTCGAPLSDEIVEACTSYCTASFALPQCFGGGTIDDCVASNCGPAMQLYEASGCLTAALDYWVCIGENWQPNCAFDSSFCQVEADACAGCCDWGNAATYCLNYQAACGFGAPNGFASSAECEAAYSGYSSSKQICLDGTVLALMECSVTCAEAAGHQGQCQNL